MVYMRFSPRQIYVCFDLQTNKESKSRRNSDYMIFDEDDHYNSYNSNNFFHQRIYQVSKLCPLYTCCSTYIPFLIHKLLPVVYIFFWRRSLIHEELPSSLGIYTPFLTSDPNVSVGKCNIRVRVNVQSYDVNRNVAVFFGGWCLKWFCCLMSSHNSLLVFSFGYSEMVMLSKKFRLLAFCF